MRRLPPWRRVARGVMTGFAPLDTPAQGNGGSAAGPHARTTAGLSAPGPQRRAESAAAERFEVVIVGGGPAGLAAGVAAAQCGVSHVVLERGQFAHTVHMYQRGKHVMAEPTRLPLQRGLPLRFEPGSREEVLAGWRTDVEKAGVQLRRGPEHEVVRISGSQGDFTLETKGGAALHAAHVVLAIGVQGNLRHFEVPGANLPHVAYQLDDPRHFEGKSIVIVGVGDAGIENALALVENDNTVHVVNRRDGFDRAKAANVTSLQAAIEGGRVTYYPNTVVDRFESGRVVLRTETGLVPLEVDLVIGRLGAIPPRRFLSDLGIHFPSEDRNAFPAVSASYESNVRGIHLIGAVAGYPLIKNCMNQGFEVVQHLLGREVLPADEPLLGEVFAGLKGTPSEIVERIRRTVPVFQKLTAIQLREFLVDATVHRLEAHQTVYERNEHGDSFFVILDGSVAVTLPERMVDTDRDAVRRRQRSIFLEAGEYFGEGALISGRRRSGTVTTSSPCVLIEVPRAAMTRLMNTFHDVRDEVSRLFLTRNLENLFPFLPKQDSRALAEAGVVHRFQKGDTLFRQGDESDALYFVQRGNVAISRQCGGREITLNYVAAGNYFGEIGLVSEEKKRTATARAAIFTEAVKLPAEILHEFLVRSPELRKEFETVEQKREQDRIEVEISSRATDLLGWLMNVGATEATDLLVIDESLCIRCNNCEKACGGTHDGVSRLDREGGPYFGNVHIPTACQHCENPTCMTRCPVDAIRRDRFGEVYIRENCIGCGNCIEDCPYGVIKIEKIVERRRRSGFWQALFGVGGFRSSHEADAASVAVKCDLCRKLQPEAPGGRRVEAGKFAACVSACPTGAIKRVDPRKWFDELRSGREVIG